MSGHKQQGVKRRFKTGHMVQHEGLYSNDWGDDLLLIQGDLFPTHPQMGETNWTYAGPSIMHLSKSPKINGHYIGY
ncbi:hypothetical protein I6N90_14950 [Paenibacillus sp. GSMTC-2017]|uniref:hypothetical protein n=1 Tax=Paenibacillus sp. GSMTC-2017 TaxID=2794350 RepID=UPI0018D90108|nr:hypothetical protein [Paenibacillus sp. GSMTC-2017]MBH5319103.1 hypothetical protein [Paenibacillus sp. GSMTC-2017]